MQRWHSQPRRSPARSPALRHDGKVAGVAGDAIGIEQERNPSPRPELPQPDMPPAPRPSSSHSLRIARASSTSETQRREDGEHGEDRSPPSEYRSELHASHSPVRSPPEEDQDDGNRKADQRQNDQFDGARLHIYGLPLVLHLFYTNSPRFAHANCGSVCIAKGRQRPAFSRMAHPRGQPQGCPFGAGGTCERSP